MKNIYLFLFQATFGCALSIQFSVTRLCFVAGRESHFLAAMSYIHHERLTPGPAVALQVNLHYLNLSKKKSFR